MLRLTWMPANRSLLASLICISLLMGSLMNLGLVLAADSESSEAASSTEEPPTTVVPAQRSNGRHQQIVSRARQGDVELIFLGDSITQGWENNGKHVWEERYSHRKALNAGIAGDRTQHVLWRLDHNTVDGLQPKLVVVMIGTNNTGDNTAEEIAAGIKAIVEKLRTKLPETKVLLLGVFPRGPNAQDENRQKLLAVNELIEPLADDKYVYFLDISKKFLEGDGTISKEVMPDFLHLSPKGYEIWGNAIEPSIVKLMGE